MITNKINGEYYDEDTGTYCSSTQDIKHDSNNNIDINKLIEFTIMKRDIDALDLKDIKINGKHIATEDEAEDWVFTGLSNYDFIKMKYM